jgi:anti-sigma regulatory factor (Ser/Thr protein kinase)
VRSGKDVPRWLSLPVAPESVRRGRRFAAEVLSAVAETDPGHVDDVVLVVSELVTNAIRAVTALGPALEAPVRLGVAAGPRWTHLHAVDTAPALPEETRPGLLASSGRGIPIITRLAALVWIEQGDRDKTLHVVLPRTGISLTPRERQALLPQPGDDTLLRPREVAQLFGVRPSTIARSAREGRLTPLLTPGGHRRYRLSSIGTPRAEGEAREGSGRG